MKPDFPVWRSLLYVSVETPGSFSCQEGNLIFSPPSQGGVDAKRTGWLKDRDQLGRYQVMT